MGVFSAKGPVADFQAHFQHIYCPLYWQPKPIRIVKFKTTHTTLTAFTTLVTPQREDNRNNFLVGPLAQWPSSSLRQPIIFFLRQPIQLLQLLQPLLFPHQALSIGHWANGPTRKLFLLSPRWGVTKVVKSCRSCMGCLKKSGLKAQKYLAQGKRSDALGGECNVTTPCKGKSIEQT